MSCTDVASILDEHRTARLAPAERAAVDEHVAACADCAAAWHGHSELLALRVPAMPAPLLARVTLAARVLPLTRPRRTLRPLVIGTTLLAGAALASMTIVSLTRSPAPDTASSTNSKPSAPSDSFGAAAPAGVEGVDEPRNTPGGARTSVEPVSTSLQLVPFVRVSPAYPAEALAANKLEGRVVIELTVSAIGEVEDARVVESTDALFDAVSLDAVRQWKYLPRIVAGKRVATENVRTSVNYQTPKTPPTAATQQALAPIGPGLPLDSAKFQATMLATWERVIADDLRGAELALDEFRSTYALTPFITGEVWNAYAYVYTLQENYDRAIDAYESAIAAFERGGSQQGRWVELANLYFARNQYDQALRTLLRPQRGIDAASRRWSPEAEVLLDKLRALGVTEETLSAR